jgi:hypothetical protein
VWPTADCSRMDQARPVPAQWRGSVPPPVYMRVGGIIIDQRVLAAYATLLFGM